MSMANRICKQCGTPLAPSEMFCSTCGTRYMEPAMSEPTQYASSSQYPNQYPGTPNPSQPQIEPTQYAGPSQSVPPYSSSPYASTPYGGNTSYGSSQSYAPPPPASSMTPPPMQYGTYGQPSTVPPPGQMGYQPPPQPKKGPNVGLIIGIVILLLVVVGGSIFFFTRSKSSTTNSTNTTSGSTATTQPSVQPIFSDDFASNSKNWDTTSGTGFSRLVGNHALTLSEANHKILIETFPISKTFSDVQLTATFTILQADSNDSLGLYIRGDSNLDHDYRVDIFGDNTYAISKELVDSSNTVRVQPIVDITSSSAIKSVGQQNTVSLIMKGSTLVLVINDQVVKTVTDTTYQDGQVAVFVQNGDTSNGVKANFSSVAIYPAPAQLPS